MNTNKNRTMAYFDVIEACSQPGCPLCRLRQHEAERYIDSVLYEMVNDPGVRADFRAARGYCDRHAWLMCKGYGRTLGVAILLREAIGNTLGALRDHDRRTPIRTVRNTAARVWRRLRNGHHRDAPHSVRDLITKLEPQAECPACCQQVTMEQIALWTLVEHLDDERLGPAFRESAGLCLPHFRQALAEAPDEETGARLIAAQREHLERLYGELSELIRKHDYRYIAEGFGIEGNSWLRAIGIVSGEKGAR